MNPNPVPSILLNFALPGDPASKKLDEIQAAIAAKLREREAVTKAELPPEEARQRLILAIEYDTNGVSGWGFRSASSPYGLYAELPAFSWGVAALLFGGSEKLAALIAKHTFERPGFYTPGLPAADREKKVKQLTAEIRDLERQEEIEILALERSGRVVLRRADLENFDLLLTLWEAAPDETQEAAA